MLISVSFSEGQLCLALTAQLNRNQVNLFGWRMKDSERVDLPFVVSVFYSTVFTRNATGIEFDAVAVYSACLYLHSLKLSLIFDHEIVAVAVSERH